MKTTLASFDNAYRLAVRLAGASGQSHIILATSSALQPVRVIPFENIFKLPSDASQTLAIIHALEEAA
jgi:hypothetical protein